MKSDSATETAVCICPSIAWNEVNFLSSWYGAGFGIFDEHSGDNTVMF